MTPTEALLWKHLRRRALGARFRRQVPIGPWVADFACLDPRIVVEVDGEPHRWAEDDDRDAYLASLGFTVLRFENRLVTWHLEGVLARIAHAVEQAREG